jgi:hypothetical protein
MWTIDGKHIIEHPVGVEDAQLAMATYQPPATVGQARPSPCGKAPK